MNEHLIKIKFYLLVVGSRGFNNYGALCDSIKWATQNIKQQIVIVSGGAQGADALGKKYAKDNGLEYIEFPAQWDLYGKAAGYRRNEQMHAFIASKKYRGCIAFWDGQSKGTAHNFELAKKYNNQIITIKF